MFQPRQFLAKADEVAAVHRTAAAMAVVRRSDLAVIMNSSLKSESVAILSYLKINVIIQLTYPPSMPFLSKGDVMPFQTRRMATKQGGAGGIN
jgi:hypothetical protein